MRSMAPKFVRAAIRQMTEVTYRASNPLRVRASSSSIPMRIRFRRARR